MNAHTILCWIICCHIPYIADNPVFEYRFCEPLMDSYDDKIVSEVEKPVGILAESLETQAGDEACLNKWSIPKSHQGAHLLRRLFSQFIKEIVEGMVGFVRLPVIMSKLLSDNGNQEFGDFKVTILGMLGTYGFERRILVCLPFKHICT